MLVVPMEITFKVDSNIILKLFKISVFRNEATNLVGGIVFDVLVN